ncbi:MAG: AmmeMemoRadiSam system protein B, partial [Firmicutes bacterium]|nr:AmmeMemoRadiSam system protein B [Bacillota bacterium]
MPLLGAFIVPHPPLIVPEVGRGQERKIQKTIDAYNEVARRIAELKPETLIVISPHSVSYADYFHIASGNKAEGSFTDFEVPEVKMSVDYDEALVTSISDIAGREGIPAGTLGTKSKRLDHGVMVPLYFINRQYKDYIVVQISLSGLSPLVHYRLGKCIVEAIEKSGKKTVIVASGDMSHKLKVDGPYGLSKDGAVFDKQATDAMAQGDFLKLLSFEEDFCESAAECGLRSFQIMSGAFDGKSVKSELLSYEGPFGVGYAVAAFSITGTDESRHFDIIFEKQEVLRLEKVKAKEDAYVRLARQSLENFVKTGKRLAMPSGLPDEMMKEQAGVFVSLKMNGRLRGCIGTISSTTSSIAAEIIQNAVSAGREDPRFDPVE